MRTVTVPDSSPSASKMLVAIAAADVLSRAQRSRRKNRCLFFVAAETRVFQRLDTMTLPDSIERL
jgi:hypothetical protein